MAIKIITDNCCDLPQELISRHHLGVVNMLVRFGEREYKPGELSNAEFYRLMQQSSVLPTTTQPTVEEMLRVYQQALADGSDVIAIHLSSGITGTVQSANLVAQMINNPRLYIIDSHKASVGLGLMALTAAQMAEAGVGLNAILSRLQEMRRTMQCMFSVGNLEYLVKGGRVSRAKGLVAGVLDIKPILYFDKEGFIMPYDKVRGHKAAQKKLLDIMDKLGDDLTNQMIGINHSNHPEYAEYLKENIIERFGTKEVIIGEIGPVIGTHVGPGTFSVFFESA